MQSEAEIVIIGCGIVGSSAAMFLAEKGWKNVVVLDQGPLFETGGSTSHAPGLVFELNSSKTMCQLAQWSVETYSALTWKDLPCFYQVGSLEVATTQERLQDLKVKLGRAHSWGLKAELIQPEQVAKQVPLLNSNQILGALSVPSDGIAKAIRAVEAMSARSKTLGVQFYGNTEVLGFKKQAGQIQGVVTSQGIIKTPKVLICAGIWGPRLGKMAGVPIPLTPVEHQYLRTRSLLELSGEKEEVAFPIVRDQDHHLYFRQQFESIGIGSYAHEPLLVDSNDIQKPGASDGLMPSLRRFTPEHFVHPRAFANDLFPCLKNAEFEQTLNGMFSFTPDGNPLVGQSTELKGFWVAEGVWVTHGAGVGRVVAQLLSEENPSVDLRELDPNRFATHVFSKHYINARGAQQYREVYDIIHPLQQMAHPRPLRTSPFYLRQKELGAVFFESAGWERPQWYESNCLLPKESFWPERTGWNSQYWSPIIGQEHKATRERVALFDLSAFAKFEVSGPGALRFLQHISANQVDQPIGRIVYTAMLNSRGGIMCDLTVTRKEEDRFWVVTGGSVGMHDRAWMLEHLPKDGSVHFQDLTSSYCCLGVWGPLARDLVQALSECDVSNEQFPYYTAQPVYLGSIPCFAMRISYAGELGWEIYTPTEYGLSLWDTLWSEGQKLGIVAAGGGAFDSLRLEKGYRLWGADIHAEYNPYEAGIGFAVRLKKGEFIGQGAAEKIKAEGSGRKLSCMTLHDSSTILLGKEPIFVKNEVVGYVTSANFGYTVNKSIAYGYLPLEYSKIGTEVQVMYLGQRYNAVVSNEPLFDPSHLRMRPQPTK